MYNTSSQYNYNGGIIFSEKATLNISDKPVVTGNVSGGSISGSGGSYTLTGGTTSNIYLKTDQTITLTGELTSGADIGVYVQNPTSTSTYPRQITTTESSTEYYADAYKYFSPDVATVSSQTVLTNANTDKYVEFKLASGTYYTVTHTLENISVNIASKASVESGESYAITLTANSGYTLPTSVTVSNDLGPLESGTDYTYDSSTGALEITSVTLALTITASGVARNLTTTAASVEVEGTYDSAITEVNLKSNV